MTNNFYAPLSTKQVKYPVLNESEFYEVFLTLDNLSRASEDRLSEKAIKLLSYILKMPKDKLLVFNSSANRGSKRFGAELGLSVSYTNYLMQDFRKKGYLIVGDENVY